MREREYINIYINKLLFRVTYNYICIYIYSLIWEFLIFMTLEILIFFHDSDLFYFGKLHNFRSQNKSKNNKQFTLLVQIHLNADIRFLFGFGIRNREEK